MTTPADSDTPGAPGPDVDRLVDRLFRHEGGRLVAILTRIFGPAYIGLAEDVAQEALVAALEAWPYHGVPKQPTAWLVQVAKNRALNAIKRDTLLSAKSRELLHAMESSALTPPADTSPDQDDVVRLLFVACHPELSPESRVALTLKTVAGLSVDQIAGALVAQPSAVAQRLVRAKKQIRDLGLAFDVPDAEYPQRLDSVLEVLYLLFTEGYAAHDGDVLIRAELCDEAMRLCRLIIEHQQADAPQPRADALLALMLLQSARLPARVDDAGELIPLEQQDRSRWDNARIVAGLRHLDRSAQGDAATGYHLEAGIAAYHAIAPTYRETDWRSILDLYDRLRAVNPSPIVALNRAVAVSQCHGVAAGIDALETVRTAPALQHYYLLWATLAKLHADAGDITNARVHYRRALACPCSAPERRFLERSLASLA